jgi:hypothetical protein
MENFFNDNRFFGESPIYLQPPGDIHFIMGQPYQESLESTEMQLEQNNNFRVGNDTKSVKFEADLYHRKRGDGGKWVKVANDERLRVSPSTGKALRIIMLSTFPIDEKDIFIIPKTLTDEKVSERGNDSVTFHGFHPSIRQSETEFYDTQVDLKLFLQGQVMKFFVQVLQGGIKYVTETISFSTHNSGKTNYKRRRDDSISNSNDQIEPQQHEEDTTKRKRISSMTETFNNNVIHTQHSTIEKGGLEIIHPEITHRHIPPPPPLPPSVSPMLQHAHIIDTDLDVMGIIRARAFYQYSDIRLKTDIEDIIDAMSIITSLSGKRFKWKENVPFEDNGNIVIGLLAQEVRKVAPEVVQETEDGYLTVNYVELIPVIISAFNQYIEQVDKEKLEIEQNFQNLRESIDKLKNNNEKDREWLKEFQRIVASMKEKKDIKRRESEMNLKKDQNIKCTRNKIVPISLLVFVVVVIFSALGILFFKIFGDSSNSDHNNNTSNHVHVDPLYSFGKEGNNLLFNPSFEEIDKRTQRIANWESKSLLETLTTEGVTNGNVQVFPRHGNKSLQLSNSDLTGIVLATQYLYPAEIPKAIYFSGWGNGDLLQKNTSGARFIIYFTLEYDDYKKYIYTLAFNNTISGWQYNELYIHGYEQKSIITMYIRCSLLYGIGHAFYDNVTVNFLYK